MVRRASPASPCGRLIRRTNTARSSTMKVGTPNTSSSLDGALVGPPDLLHRRSGLDLGQDLVARQAHAVEHAGDDLGDAQVQPLVVSGGEERDVRVEEAVGVAVAHDDAGGQREEVTGLGGVVPHRYAALGHVRLAQRERQERHVPVGPVGQGDGEMLMGVAGEGAAIVPGDGE